MPIHRISAIPDKFKKGKERNRAEHSTVVERIQRMKKRRAEAQHPDGTLELSPSRNWPFNRG